MISIPADLARRIEEVQRSFEEMATLSLPAAIRAVDNLGETLDQVGHTFGQLAVVHDVQTEILSRMGQEMQEEIDRQILRALAEEVLVNTHPPLARGRERQSRRKARGLVTKDGWELAPGWRA